MKFLTKYMLTGILLLHVPSFSIAQEAVEADTPSNVQQLLNLVKEGQVSEQNENARREAEVGAGTVDTVRSRLCLATFLNVSHVCPSWILTQLGTFPCCTQQFTQRCLSFSGTWGASMYLSRKQLHLSPLSFQAVFE